MAISPETVGYIDHEQGQIRRIRDSRGGDIHEVFQAPVLFSVSKVKLDLEPQTVIVHEWCVCQGQITTEQNDVGTGLGAQVSLDDDDDIQWLRELLVEQWHLVQAGLDVPPPRRLFLGFCRGGGGSYLVALLSPGASPRLGARSRGVQRRPAPQLRKELPDA